MRKRHACFILFLVLFVVIRYTVGNEKTSVMMYVWLYNIESCSLLTSVFYPEDKAYLSLPRNSERYFLRLGGFEFNPQRFTFWTCSVMM